MWAIFCLALTLSLLLLALAPAPAVCKSCGIKPIPPIPPIGCRDMRAVCVCDDSGRRCAWQWICV